MDHLTPEDLFKLEDYARERAQFRSRLMTHKRPRRLPIGDHLALYFEDRLTIQYQIQEMLRTERIFEREGIQEELDAYNPLIPDGDNWKATCMIEYTDADERRQRLNELVGIEDRIWVKIGEREPVFAIADEDLDRATEDKTSAVHFLRFQLPDAAIAELKNGALLTAGVAHPRYDVEVSVPAETREALLADLD